MPLAQVKPPGGRRINFTTWRHDALPALAERRYPGSRPEDAEEALLEAIMFNSRLLPIPAALAAVMPPESRPPVAATGSSSPRKKWLGRNGEARRQRQRGAEMSEPMKTTRRGEGVAGGGLDSAHLEGECCLLLSIAVLLLSYYFAIASYVGASGVLLFLRWEYAFLPMSCFTYLRLSSCWL